MATRICLSGVIAFGIMTPDVNSGHEHSSCCSLTHVE
jgi:hypothetical protein